ncbi:MAG: bifunctional (p)ppGpp synthetase/guanosine-3',5'-bis(diphosphate) 3'-pyrophosphohydrolase, partial [Thermoflexales bacterium]|nr:bifunctional (p)ppGpp synthetase/guanosine-3',5'-bis(diphosphate) 3'-pyrophosphohydrolase [Thermoflexales bacterium]
VARAYRLAEAAHHGQTRRSGEPYILHPLAVACILAKLKLDPPTIAAALLHDVVEDTSVTLDDIRAQFGPGIAHLVGSVTKLSKHESVVARSAESASVGDDTDSFAYRTDREAESLRKMLLGLVDDVRVVLIKLADRLHNMRTLEALPSDKQRRMARETLDIYAPLANRLGIWEWKQELEDLGFRYAEPEQYAFLQRLLAATDEAREARVRRYIVRLRDALAEAGIYNVEITGRAKHIYSIWRKMQRKNLSFDKIRDTQAIRVIIEDDNASAEQASPPSSSAEAIAEDESGEVDVGVIADELQRQAQLDRVARARERRRQEMERLMAQPAVQACYMALGVVHRLWKPLPGEFDDYIAVPKENHYQSLHTAVIDEEGKILEVQIRTRSMHRAAEYGVAAHWLYKDDAKLTPEYQKRIEYLREAIRSLGKDTEDAKSFVDALRTDHLKDTVFCFTPKGKLIELPVGATIIDFAYRIHTEIGDHCRGGKVNGRLVPLTYRLQNGDIVEVLTRPNATPSRDWLHDPSYVATNAARSKIRQWFRRQDRAQNIAAGREMIERELKRLGVANWMKLEDVLKLFRVEPGKEEDFFERVGYGTITLPSIAARVLEEERRRERERQERLDGLVGTLPVPPLRQRAARKPAKEAGGWVVGGVPGLKCEAARCCNPLPGDEVIGYVTHNGQGIKIHRRDCPEIANADPQRLIEVSFVGENVEPYPTHFRVLAAERTGLLADLSNVLADNRVNITQVNILKRDLRRGEVVIHIAAELYSAQQVPLLLNRLSKVNNVFEVTRVISARGR